MKYSASAITKLDKFTIELDESADSDFWKHCSVHHVARLLGVCKDTVYEWAKTHEDFSDSLKKWQTIRDAKFLELRNKNGAWIFLAKNWLEMRDDQHVKVGNLDEGGFKVLVEKCLTDKRPSEGVDE